MEINEEQKIKNWFVNWFESPYYHLLYKKRDKKEAKVFINNILKFTKPKKTSYFLDLCCGLGRHSIYLNRLGYKVDGIDLSKQSINFLKEKNSETLNFKNLDMRNLTQKNKYHYVLNLFTSFGYFDQKKDNQLVIHLISKSLKKNGVFLIDFINMKYCLKNIVKTEIKKTENITFYIKRWRDKRFLYKSIRFKKNNKNYNYTERLEILHKSDFMAFCKKENLDLINCFGDYELNNFNENSKRLILLFKKVIN